jgi:hypothetical protein
VRLCYLHRYLSWYRCMVTPCKCSVNVCMYVGVCSSCTTYMYVRITPCFLELPDTCLAEINNTELVLYCIVFKHLFVLGLFFHFSKAYYICLTQGIKLFECCFFLLGLFHQNFRHTRFHWRIGINVPVTPQSPLTIIDRFSSMARSAF